MRHVTMESSVSHTQVFGLRGDGDQWVRTEARSTEILLTQGEIPERKSHVQNAHPIDILYCIPHQDHEQWPYAELAKETRPCRQTPLMSRIPDHNSPSRCDRGVEGKRKRGTKKK